MKPMAPIALKRFAEEQKTRTCLRLVDKKCGKDGPVGAACCSRIKADPRVAGGFRVLSALDDFGRERLSKHYFMRDFLYSEIASVHGIPNVPDNAELAIEAGRGLCENLLEPLHSIFGHVTIRSAFRSVSVNGFGNCHKLNCSSNKKSYANHVWDYPDKHGYIGATACIVIPWFVDWLEGHPGYDWRSLAWFIHDHLPYSEMVFFPVLGPDGELLPTTGCNLSWRRCREGPDRPRSCDPRHKIRSFPAGILTAPGMANYAGRHDCRYPNFPDLAAAREPSATVSAAPAASKWPDYLRDARMRKKDEDEWFEELRCQQEAGETNPAFAVWRKNWVEEVNKAWKRAGRGKGTFRERETWYEGELAASRGPGSR